MKFKYTCVSLGYVSPTVTEVKRGSYYALTINICIVEISRCCGCSHS